MLCATPGWVSPSGKLAPETGIPFGNGGSGGLSGDSSSARLADQDRIPVDDRNRDHLTGDWSRGGSGWPRASRLTVSGWPATGVTVSGGFSGTSRDPGWPGSGLPVALAITSVPAASFAKLIAPSATFAFLTAFFASFGEVTAFLARFLFLTAFLARFLFLTAPLPICLLVILFAARRRRR